MWCVYKHTSPSGKAYIGITSQRPESRWRNGEGYKYNTHFSNAIHKYSWDNFEHEILADNLTEKEAKEMEIDLIKELGTQNPDLGYNITSGGDGTKGLRRFGASNSFYGKSHSANARKKISQYHKLKTGKLNNFYGKHHSEETKRRIAEKRSFPVLKFDLDLNLLCEYPSAIQAARDTGIKHSQILGCCNNSIGYKSAGGFVWIFKSDAGSIDFEIKKKELNHEKLPKPILQFNKSMDLLNEYRSIAEAAKSNCLAASDISNAANGVCQTSGGYIWIFKSEYQKMLDGVLPMFRLSKPIHFRPVLQFSENMNLICEYDTITAAAESINYTRQALNYAIKKSKTGKLGGYIWKYKEVS